MWSLFCSPICVRQIPGLFLHKSQDTGKTTTYFSLLKGLTQSNRENNMIREILFLCFFLIMVKENAYLCLVTRGNARWHLDISLIAIF